MQDEAKRLKDAFEQSASKWGGWVSRVIEEADHLVIPVSEHVERLFPADWAPRRYRVGNRIDEWGAVASIARSFVNILLVQEFDRRTDGPGCLHNMLELTESPIEAAFLLALLVAAREHYLDVTVEGQDPTARHPFHARYAANQDRRLLVRPQAQIGEYRVDFMLEFEGYERQRVESSSVRPGDRWQDVRVSRSLVVECDGHDYHERTKEQARADKSRDRKLQSLGVHVFRYTGSEIFADVFGHAAQALNFVSGVDFDDGSP